MDGQILDQLHPLSEQEEGARATAPWRPGTLHCLRPSFPSMDSWEVRLASFCDWPLTAMVRPELLAAAGFFYSSQQDIVRCFCCCGGLWDWEQGDDPWTEHARWFPRCEFLLRTKGRDFVCSVQQSCCHLPGSWDQWEELDDAAHAALSAPVHSGPELPTPRRQTHSEGSREPGTRDLEERLQRLQEERTCKVCLDQLVRVVLVPCGHLVCAQCAAKLHLCPICRAPIQSRVRTFLS